MRRVLVSVLFLAFVLSLSVTPALAAKENPTATELQNIIPTPIILGPAGPAQTCVLGNLNPPAWAISGWMLPPEEYKLLFDPHAGCGVCTYGFEVTTVHVMLQTAEACSLIMSVDVEEADVTDPSCPLPGAVWCQSAQFMVVLPSAGLWDIGLPIAPCHCLTMDRLYLLSAWFEWSSCQPDLVTDNFPTNCTSWNNWGSGWVDLVAQVGFPGNLMFWADAQCCSPPTPVEGKTWGAIKELYND